MKDRNQNLLHTCFLESVFVHNGYLQYDGLEMFPVSEMSNVRSFLQGNSKAEKRNFLYRFFIDNIDVINMLILLKNINLVYDKLRKKLFVKCNEGVNTLKDLLYIFTMIVDSKDRDKNANSNSTNQEEDENGEPVLIQILAATSNRKGVKTMNDAIVVVEKMLAIYSKFDVLARAFDASLAPGLDKLAESLALKFDNLVEFALPKEFWSKYRKPKKKPPAKRRRVEGSISDGENDDVLETDTN